MFYGMCTGLSCIYYSTEISITDYTAKYVTGETDQKNTMIERIKTIVSDRPDSET